MVTLLGGHAASVGTFVLQKMEVIPSIHFTIVAGGLFALSSILYLATLNLGQAKAEGDSGPPRVRTSPAQPRWKLQAPVRRIARAHSRSGCDLLVEVGWLVPALVFFIVRIIPEEVFVPSSESFSSSFS